jgi:hypothetical protein
MLSVGSLRASTIADILVVEHASSPKDLSLWLEEANKVV